MGYSRDQLRELEKTINATECDALISATPVDLERVIRSRHPVRRATYELKQLSGPSLATLLSGVVDLRSSEAGFEGAGD